MSEGKEQSKHKVKNEINFNVTAVFKDEGKTFEELMQEIFKQTVSNGR